MLIYSGPFENNGINLNLNLNESMDYLFQKYWKINPCTCTKKKILIKTRSSFINELVLNSY